MFPKDFITRIKSQNSINPEELLKSLGMPEPVSIRTNPGKWNKKPSAAEKVQWSENGWYLGVRPSYTLDPLFHAGSYYPQEASGMFLEAVFKQLLPDRSGIKVLDLCGAPGGKSTHIASLIGENSLLIANEVIRSRASVLAENLTKWGSGNVIVTQNDPALFSRLGAFFDVIVVDAPCSGEGMFRDEIAKNEWSVSHTEHCSERQKRILIDIWPALKEDGLLIYSTCTFNPEENEKNIGWLVGKKGAESIKLNISEFEGIVEIQEKGVYGYGFYPDKIRGNGLFVSVLKKNEITQESEPGRQNISEISVTGKDLSVIRDFTIPAGKEFIKMGDDLFRLGCTINDFLFVRKKLKIIKAGTRLCTVKNNDYIPAHELALSINLKEGAFPVAELNYDEAISYLRRDNINISGLAKGWNIIAYKEVKLGFVKNIGNRLNNYFPVEWRIRMDKGRSFSENIIEWENI